MTIIAFDGNTVASDRQMTDNGLKSYTKKLFRLEDCTIIAVTGDFAISLALKKWYEDGRKEGQCPAKRDKDNWGHIVVFKTDGTIEEYENCDQPIPLTDKFMAWGSGRGYALAAMSLGKSAQEAVEIASQFDVFCGLGVDSMVVREKISSKQPERKKWFLNKNDEGELFWDGFVHNGCTSIKETTINPIPWVSVPVS